MGCGSSGGVSPVSDFVICVVVNRSISSAATLAPFVLALELGALREMWSTFGVERIVKVREGGDATSLGGEGFWCHLAPTPTVCYAGSTTTTQQAHFDLFFLKPPK